MWPPLPELLRKEVSGLRGCTRVNLPISHVLVQKKCARETNLWGIKLYTSVRSGNRLPSRKQRWMSKMDEHGHVPTTNPLTSTSMSDVKGLEAKLSCLNLRHHVQELFHGDEALVMCPPFIETLS